MTKPTTAPATVQTNEVAAPGGQLPAAGPNPAQLLQLAVEKGADVEKLEKLMELQERWEAREAKKLYARAIAEFKSKPLEIKKDSTVDYTSSKGRTFYTHASLPGIQATVDPLLAAAGLSYRWHTEQGPSGVVVTCEVSHVAGHMESVSLQSSPDQSGGKNSIQAIGSAVTYLQRYTLMAALGLSAGDDDDGQSAQPVARESRQQQRQQPRQQRQETQQQPQQQQPAGDPPLTEAELQQFQGCIDREQVEGLDRMLRKAGWRRADFCLAANIQQINHLTVDRYEGAIQNVAAKIRKAGGEP